MDNRYLFRGKRIDNGEWVQGYYWHNTTLPLADIGRMIPGQDVHAIAVMTPGHSKSYDVDPATIGQCTGLCDKDGTLIFEGDILTLDNKYHPRQEYESTITVVWDKFGFCYRYPDEKDLRHTPSIKTTTTFRVDEYELGKFSVVIGNIHDTAQPGAAEGD